MNPCKSGSTKSLPSSAAAPKAAKAKKGKDDEEPSLVLTADSGKIKKEKEKSGKHGRTAGQVKSSEPGLDTTSKVLTPAEMGAPPPTSLQVNGDDIPKIAEMSWASLAWEVAGSLGSALSGDLFSSGISLPCNMYEPLSILQRSIEFLEFTSCIDVAAKQKLSTTRLAYIAGFALSPLPIAENRWKLDFNPILGETFEYIDTRGESPVKCFTEQVSHHPPIAAVHAENANFRFYQNYGAVTNFLGNSVEVATNSKSYVYLKETKEEYLILAPKYVQPQIGADRVPYFEKFCEIKIRVHNLIMGTMWMEYFGDLIVDNLTTGDTCTLKFSKSGWLAGGPDYLVAGYIKNKAGQKRIKLKGMWDTNLQALFLDDHGEDGAKGKQFCPWRRKKLNFEGKQFPLTPFAWSFTAFPEELQKQVLPSDSRRRPDRAALNAGDADLATAWKRVAESRQRAEQKARRGDKKEDPWKANWFTLEKDHAGNPFYNMTPKYWELREAEDKKGENGTVIMPPSIKDGAADFMNYKKNFSQLLETSGKKSKAIVVGDN